MIAASGAPVAKAVDRANLLRLCGFAVVCLGAAAWLLNFPVLRLGLAALYLVTTAAVAWRPLLIWWMLPVAMCGLDLAPWSGRFFFDEFDALLGLWIAAAWWRGPATAPARDDRLLQAAVAAVALSFVLGTARALVPWPAIDANAFVSLLSPYNALRIGRGAVWACLLAMLARRQRASASTPADALANGMVLALLGTVLFIFGERLLFSDWLDFADGYRVAGPFSAMNTGGAYVECLLATAMPFLMTMALRRPTLPRLGCASALTAATVYAVAVTFSRAGIASFALGVLTTSALMLMRRRIQPGLRIPAATLALVLLSAVVAWPVVTGPYGQTRVSQIQRDLGTREGHWQQSLRWIDGDIWTRLFGMGIGRFPATHLLNSLPQDRTATARLMNEPGQTFVRLGSGRALYVEQFVDIEPGTDYTLLVRLRSGVDSRATLVIELCEKWLIASANCETRTFSSRQASRQWLAQSQSIASGKVGAEIFGLRRPVKLSFNLHGTAPLDLAEIEITRTDGRSLLQNGNFAQGLDHWFFTSDQHLAWHIKSMPLAILFDQGLFGALAIGCFTLLALYRSGPWAIRQSVAAVPLFGALVSFIAIGSIDTLIDSPRFLTLFLVLAYLACSSSQRPAAEARNGANRSWNHVNQA